MGILCAASALVLKHLGLSNVIDVVAIRRQERVQLLGCALQAPHCGQTISGDRMTSHRTAVTCGDGPTCSPMIIWLSSHQYVSSRGTANPQGLP